MSEPHSAQLPVPDLVASDFHAAAESVLAFLHHRIGFGLWMVTRVDGNDWIALATEDHGYGIRAGELFVWSDSFCSRMVQGLGPRVAPVSDAVPAYLTAPIGQQVPIGAYVGVPIHSGTEMFGTLCAINPTAMPEAIAQEQPLIELLAGLLGKVLTYERLADRQQQRAERAEMQAMSDALTGVFNRRGWETLLEQEEKRAQRYGDPVAVLVIDLDGMKTINDTEGHPAGDALLQRTAAALRGVSRDSDIVSRLGGDEFGMILIGCGTQDLPGRVEDVRRALAASSVSASVAGCARHPATGLSEAFEKADLLMLAEKAANGLGRRPAA